MLWIVIYIEYTYCEQAHFCFERETEKVKALSLCVYIYVISSMYKEVIIKLVEWGEWESESESWVLYCRLYECLLLSRFCFLQKRKFISLEIGGVVFRIKFIIICLVNVIKIDSLLNNKTGRHGSPTLQTHTLIRSLRFSSCSKKRLNKMWQNCFGLKMAVLSSPLAIHVKIHTWALCQPPAFQFIFHRYFV